MKISHKKTLLLALLSWKVFSADTVNIGVTGNIVASPCIFNGGNTGNDSNLLIVFYVQIMPDDFVMQLHRF